MRQSALCDVQLQFLSEDERVTELSSLLLLLFNGVNSKNKLTKINFFGEQQLFATI